MVVYTSTRDDSVECSMVDAILRGTAPGGGLYVPKVVPDGSSLRSLQVTSGYTLVDVVVETLSIFGLTEAIPIEDIRELVSSAYSDFWLEDTIRVQSLGNGHHIANLHYGPTLSFKDYALAVVGKVFNYLLHKQGKRGIVLTATSGDTGSAAMQNLAGDNVDVLVTYPHDRISLGQEKQMVQLNGAHARAFAVQNGTFDYCQSVVKDVLNDHKLVSSLDSDGICLLSANSINWLRIAVQTGYNAYLALKYGSSRKPLDFFIPSGNSGHWLSVWYAKQLLQFCFPGHVSFQSLVGGIMISTNENSILRRFFTDLEHVPEDIVSTISPSMDIEISSNLERFLFYTLGAEKTLALSQERSYTLSDRGTWQDIVRFNMQADTASMGECRAAIRSTYLNHNLVIEPHTATACVFFDRLCCDRSNCMVLSTAHPSKFISTVAEVLLGHCDGSDLDLINRLHLYIPDAMRSVLSMSQDSLNKKRVLGDMTFGHLKQQVLETAVRHL